LKEVEPVLAQEVRQNIVDHSKIMRNYNRALARKYNKTLEEDIRQAAKDTGDCQTFTDSPGNAGANALE